jgi:hypothetical protein
MKEVIADKSLIAFCGLYCGACGKYLQEKCPGCKENMKAGWCKVRSCCIENNYKSCADCKTFPLPHECKKFNNFFSKLFGLFFKSDRVACICYIQQKGYCDYAEFMSKNKLQSIKRKK